MRFFLILQAAFFAYTPSDCQTPILLDDVSLIYRLDTLVEVYLDPSDNVPFHQVSSPEFQDWFKPHKEYLTFGYLKSAIWLKVHSRSTSPHSQWYLEIPAPFLEYVDFYQLQDSIWHHSKSGYFRKQSENEFSHTGHIVPLHFSADSTTTVYVKIAGVSPKTFPLRAIEENNFVRKTRFEDLGYGIFYGILIVMFFYNVFIYFNLRQKNYLLYSCIIASTFFVFAAITGYGGKFLWPEKPVFNYVAGKLTLEILVSILAIYTINFLEVKRYSKAIYYILWSLIPLAIISLVLVITKTVNYAGNNLITLSTLVFMAAGIVVLLKGNKAALYFIAAWTFYFLGGLLLTLRNSGILDYNFSTTHVAEIGAVLGTTIMGFGLGAQYRKLKKEKKVAQLLALRMQQEDTAKLEVKVSKRTEQLYKANRELQRTLETNKRQTEIIESKNTELDTFFYRVSHDLKGPVASSLGMMQLAKMDVKDEVALAYIDRQYAQMERLSQTINGLVNLTKLNNSDLVKEKIDFAQMIDDCIISFNNAVNFSRLTFEKNIDQNIQFYSEWTLLNAIIQNLIENSIKYCRGESPFVRINVYDESGFIAIAVEDNGQGIPAEHQARIFEMFYRATREAEGNGLGLYILKRSVDRLQGTVEIKSEVKKGSTFIVRLPSHTTGDSVVVNP